MRPVDKRRGIVWLGLASLLAVGLVVATPVTRADGRGQEKVTICHVPPGNPDNAHTIIVGAPAVPAHLAHGDSLGTCPVVVPPDDPS